ncbi:hypothetical protein R5R35_002814 [Gryllus longicercus]|uniref:Accessory gland protein n=1 Tax=Gryllus longicercus TaxID=2509291 RepID=A0AAN9VMM7_9ORTH
MVLLVLLVAMAGATAATATATTELERKEDKPTRHPHHLYSHYGWLTHGYDYYSVATLAALKFKAALVVAALFVGLAWWYGLKGYGYGLGYGGYGHAQSKFADHRGDYYVQAYDRDDYQLPAPAPASPPLRAQPRPRPAPTPPRTPPPRKHEAAGATARAGEQPNTLQWFLKG